MCSVPRVRGAPSLTKRDNVNFAKVGVFAVYPGSEEHLASLRDVQLARRGRMSFVRTSGIIAVHCRVQMKICMVMRLS